MSIRKREVKVHQVPQTLTVSVQRSFLLNLQQCAEAERPRFVLDCSMIGDMNYALINLLLSCLEAVMKCNGDVRLAALNPTAMAAFRVAGLDRIFETYATTESAVQSFHQRPISLAPFAQEPEVFGNVSEHAA